MKILAFAASNSKKSINKQLLSHAVSFLDAEVELIDINDFDLPIYSEDIEAERGIPQAARDFLDKIADASALLISYAEHNGGYAVAYKNLFDWASRENRHVYQGRPVVMLATSPGAAGGSSVLSTAVNSAHFFHGEVVGSLSVPKLHENFDIEKGYLREATLRDKLEETVSRLDELARDQSYTHVA